MFLSKGGARGLDKHSQKLLDPGQVFLSKGGARGRIHILKSYWARGRCFSRKGAPGNQKVWLNGRTGAGVSLERGRPVRDQGGIKAGPRRDHILFNLFVTDYHQLSTVFVFLYFFELQAFALYQSSEILSKRLGEISYSRISARAAASTAAPRFRDNSSPDTACCLLFYIR